MCKYRTSSCLAGPANTTPAQFGPAVSAVLNGKNAVRSVVTNQLADAALFTQRQSAVIRDTFNTKIARLINTVNAGSNATQGILRSGGSQIQGQAQRMHGSLLTLRGQIAAAQNLKAAAKADLQNVVGTTTTVPCTSQLHACSRETSKMHLTCSC